MYKRFYIPATDTKGDQRKILAISALFALAILCFFCITVSWDSREYIDYAYLMTGVPNDSVYYRTMGYPLIMLISGVPWLNSLVGLILLQGIMGTLIPLIIYKIMLNVDRRVAFYTALGSIITLLPYTYIKCIWTELPYMFFQFIALYFAVVYFKTQRPPHIYAMTFAVFAMILIRPSATMIFMIFIPATIIFVPRNILHSLFALVLLIASMLVSFAYHTEINCLPRTFTNPTYMTGKNLFFNVYLTSDGLMNKDNGPATEELIHTVNDMLYYHWDEVEEITRPFDITDFQRTFFYERFDGDPEGLTNYMFESPALTYYRLMFYGMHKFIGPEKTDELLLNSSLELLRKHPFVGIKFFVRNLAGFFMPVQIGYKKHVDPNERIGIQVSFLVVGSSRPRIDFMNGLPRKMIAEVKFDPLGEIIFYGRKSIKYIWTALFITVRPLIFILMLLGLFLNLKTKHRPIVFLLFGVVAYQALITSIFQEAASRFIHKTFLIEFMLAMIALSHFYKRIKGSQYEMADRDYEEPE
ncbi:MAG: hypothetical protein ABIH66_10495 [bacterium]